VQNNERRQEFFSETLELRSAERDVVKVRVMNTHLPDHVNMGCVKKKVFHRDEGNF
jgi:hypothetical protein